MAEELAHWIAGSGQRATDPAALRATTLFAGEPATMRLARDDVRVQWFPPGSCVIEQGEPANALYLILLMRLSGPESCALSHRATGHGGLPPPGRALKTGRKTAEDLGQELRHGSEGRRPGCGAAR